MPNKPIRPIRIEGQLAYVKLTQGYEAVIDAADVPIVSGFNWCAKHDGNTVYAVRTDRSGAKQKTIRMHRAIMGDPDDLEVDHKDGNGLHNWRDNLREASKAQNAHNRRKSASNKSGYKGVCWCKRKQQWLAQIVVGGKSIRLGYFENTKAAHAAYCQASEKYHGDFGRAK